MPIICSRVYSILIGPHRLIIFLQSSTYGEYVLSCGPPSLVVDVVYLLVVHYHL